MAKVDDKAKKSAQPAGGAEPERTLIVVGDDGFTYKLLKDDWMKEEFKMKDPVSRGIADNLETFGVYLSYIPTDIAIGIGNICTFINLKLILQNNNVPPLAPPKDLSGAAAALAAPKEGSKTLAGRKKTAEGASTAKTRKA